MLAIRCSLQKIDKIENTKKKILPSVSQPHVTIAVAFLPFRLCFIEGQQKHRREEGGGSGEAIPGELWKPVHWQPWTAPLSQAWALGECVWTLNICIMFTAEASSE